MRKKKRSQKRKKGFCLPGGYRYCGPGCSGPGMPINYIDSCCKEHDHCIKKYGPCCKCDQALIRCVQAKTNQRTREGKTSRLISDVMKLKIRLVCKND
ncbi:Parvovirus coat protein VP1-like protein [Niallia sp. 03133]|uniref:Parvovirus coat protein VP1-like protein n=1 Tax=Niallia sp. 03133 TaxID=3458060 RepID=UPI004043A4A8